MDEDARHPPAPQWVKKKQRDKGIAQRKQLGQGTVSVVRFAYDQAREKRAQSQREADCLSDGCGNEPQGENHQQVQLVISCARDALHQRRNQFGGDKAYRNQDQQSFAEGNCQREKTSGDVPRATAAAR